MWTYWTMKRILTLLIFSIKYIQPHFFSSNNSHISQITSSRSKTLIDKIFSTDADTDAISGNIVANIFDHLAQFLCFPVSQNQHKKRKQTYKTKWITHGIQKSMTSKDRLYKKSLRIKDPKTENALHDEINKNRNYIDILTWNSKAKSIKIFFKTTKK